MNYSIIYSQIKEDKPTRSEIFSAYNAIKALARKGLFDMARVNRALGLMISQALKGSRPVEEDYVTTSSSCSCPDCRYRKVVCKHMIAFYMLEKIDEKREAEASEEAPAFCGCGRPLDLERFPAADVCPDCL